MKNKYLLLLVIIPAVEIGVFLWLSQLIGAWWVAGLIIATGLLGIFFLRYQGMETIRRVQMQWSRGIPPADELLNGVILMFGAVLLILPGFVLDIVGLLLIIPWTRNQFKNQLKRFVTQLFSRSTIVYRRW